MSAYEEVEKESDRERQSNEDVDGGRDSEKPGAYNDGKEEEDEEKSAPDRPWEAFVVDTETSGFRGMSITHPRHVVLQICCFHPRTQDVFECLCAPIQEDFILAEESTKCHGITMEMLEESGKPLNWVMDKFLVWVKTHTEEDKTVMMIAHNADFDRDMILRSLPPRVAGVSGSLLGWQWYDSLAAMRTFYPEVAENMHKEEYKVKPYSGYPYKLQSLMHHFNPGFVPRLGSHFHCAIFDANCLDWLFHNVIIPKEANLLDAEKWKKTKSLLDYRGESGRSQDKRLTLVQDIKWYGMYRAAPLNAICNEWFDKCGEEWDDMKVPVGAFTAAHVVAFGLCMAMANTPLRLNNGHKSDDMSRDLWWHVIMNVEVILRRDLEIFSDDIIVELFSYMCNSTKSDFCTGFRKEDDMQLIFPSLPGHPISYLPFELEAETCEYMFSRYGIRTVHEFYVEYTMRQGEERTLMVYDILAAAAEQDKIKLTVQNVEDTFAIVQKCWVFGIVEEVKPPQEAEKEGE